MEILKTIAIDITHSVFSNDTEALLYVTKDIYSDSYIISVPTFTFSCSVRETHTETDLEWIRDNFNSRHSGELVEAIRKAIVEF